MNPLIRAADLGDGTRKIGVRARPPEPLPTPVPSNPVKTGPSPADLAREKEEWLARAHADMAAAREREEKEGHAAGYAKGLADAQAAFREKLHQLERLVTTFGEAFAGRLDSVEDIAVAIGFEATVKILGQAMGTREGVHAAVSNALSRARAEERLLLRLAPRDFYLLLQQPGESFTSGAQNVEMVPDERVELGGCLIETAAGALDARLETQLDILRGLLLDLRAGHRPS